MKHLGPAPLASSSAEAEGYSGANAATCIPGGTSESPEWLATIQRVRPGIVALRVTGTRSFEDTNPGSWFGTGFVVDAEAGLIVTNRHVLTAGPVRALAYFDQNEELPCRALYRDPCHDFALLSFDPKALEFTSVVAVELKPDELTVGSEIRVVGNDNAEKLQILSGTVARVDRNAPKYSGLYSDENTFYVGAASATSGGSSGSPVLNDKGHAVALNAGGAQDAASAYYLPLDRVVPAVEALRVGKVPRRGTIGCRLTFKTFAAAAHLGLTAEQKRRAVEASNVWAEKVAGRQPRRGVLVCEKILPGGPAAEAGVEPGDVLLDVNGNCCVDFVDIEDAIDQAAPEPWSANEGKELDMRWARLGQERSTSMRALDFHPLIPRDFVECGAAIFHSLSYQRAMRWNIPVVKAGAYISLAGIFGAAGAGVMVVELSCGGKTWPTPDLDAMFRGLQEIPDDAYFHLRYRDWSGNGHGRERGAEVRMDRRLWPLALWRFSPELPNTWCLENECAAEKPKEATETTEALPGPAQTEDCFQDLPAGSPRRSLVEVSFFTHTRLVFEGIKPRGMSATLFRRRGVGVVVDLERRLVLTARATVPQHLGCVEVTFAQSLTVDAKPLLLHPELNVVVLQLCEPFPAGVEAMQLLNGACDLFDSPLKGSYVGLDHRGHEVEREDCCVTAEETWNPPLLSPPRPRMGHNCELVQACNDEEISDGLGGLLFLLEEELENKEATEQTALDESRTKPAAAAVFLEFIFDSGPECHYVLGIPANALQHVVASARAAADAQSQRDSSAVESMSLNETSGGSSPSRPRFPSLELEVAELSFAEARRKKGLPAEWLEKLSARRPKRKSCLVVERMLDGGTASLANLRGGDLLLSAAGMPLLGPSDLQEALASHAGDSVPVEIWRGGAVVKIDVQVAGLPPDSIRRCLSWHGMMLAVTPRAYEEVWGRSKPSTSSGGRPSGPGVTVLSVLLGSPAGEEDGFRSNTRLVAVDGRPIQDLDDLLATQAPEPSSSPAKNVVVTLLDGDGQTYVRALRPDPIFWPAVELQLMADQRWHRRQKPTRHNDSE